MRSATSGQPSPPVGRPVNLAQHIITSPAASLTGAVGGINEIVASASNSNQIWKVHKLNIRSASHKPQPQCQLVYIYHVCNYGCQLVAFGMHSIYLQHPVLFQAGLQVVYRLVQNCVTLSQWFSHKTAAFYTEECTSPSHFHNFKVKEVVRTGYWRPMASLAMPFSKLVRMHTNQLEKIQLSFKIADLTNGCVHEDRESLFHPLLIWCLNRAWSVVLQPILHTSTEEACEDRLAGLW